MGKLPNFGVDMFFLKLLESKKWKNTSFGVDMFSQTPGVQKIGKID